MCVCRVCFWIGVPPRQPRPYFHDAGIEPGLAIERLLARAGFPVDRPRVVGQRVDARPVDVRRSYSAVWPDGAVVAGAGERDAAQVRLADLLRRRREQRQRIDVARRKRLRAHQSAGQRDRDDAAEESVHARLPANLDVRRDECDRADRTAAAADDLQRRGDHHRAGRRQSIEIAEAGQAELAVAVHDVVIRKRRIERRRPGPASVPIVSTPTPSTSRSAASNFDVA